MRKPRLLVLSAAIGAGHLKAGEALCQAYAGRCDGEARHVDFLRYASPRFSRWVEETYYLMTKRTPSVYKLLYQMVDRPNSPTQKSEILIGLKKYRDLVREYRPHAIVSTHFFPAAIVSYLYPHFAIPNGVVLTDYVSHHIWINPNTNLFFVAHDGMAEELLRLGVAAPQIRVTGIPIRPFFGRQLDRRQLQQQLGINPERLTLLLMSGGNAIGPLVEVLKCLGRLEDRFQIIVITGRNQKLYRRLKEMLTTLQLAGDVLGYVENVHEYMAVADLLISKAGGLTVTEALTMGLPMAIIQPTPGQEDGNTDFLLKAGAGVYLKSVAAVEPVVGELVRNPAKIAAMRQNALRFAKPDAAVTVVTEIDRLIQAKWRTK
ncbi:MAG: glycosyltransferase [Bacillota bacterium]|jgi:processive 1,2-diacylglycerol beta-glucosyltransferase